MEKPKEYFEKVYEERKKAEAAINDILLRLSLHVELHIDRVDLNQYGQSMIIFKNPL